MTSANGNIFCVTGHLCGEFPAQSSVTRSFDVFFDLRLKNGWVNNREAGDLRRHRARFDVTLVIWQKTIEREKKYFSPWKRVFLSYHNPISRNFNRVEFQFSIFSFRFYYRMALPIPIVVDWIRIYVLEQVIEDPDRHLPPIGIDPNPHRPQIGGCPRSDYPDRGRSRLGSTLIAGRSRPVICLKIHTDIVNQTFLYA